MHVTIMLIVHNLLPCIRAAHARSLDLKKSKLVIYTYPLDTPDIKYNLRPDDYSGFIIIPVIKDSKD